MDGLLERPLQVHRALLDHLADVLDPVLLVLDAGGLCVCVCVVKGQYLHYLHPLG